MLIDLTLRTGNPKKNPSNMSHQTICSIAFPLFLYFLQFTDKYVLEGYRLSHNFQFIHQHHQKDTSQFQIPGLLLMLCVLIFDDFRVVVQAYHKYGKYLILLVSLFGMLCTG